MSHNDGSQQTENDQPILTPPPESDLHWVEVDPRGYLSPMGKVALKVYEVIKKPGDWFRENIVEPNRGPKYYWYHRRYPRVLPIDECYTDDEACIFEANLEFHRNKKVDLATLSLLKVRRDNCYYYYKDDYGFEQRKSEKCKALGETYDREELNFFIKYGELPFNANVINAYTKQKHRMIVERRRALMKKEKSEEDQQ